MTDLIPPMAIDAPALDGRFVRLEPIEEAHRDGLRAVADDAGIWTYMPTDGRAGFTKMFDEALAARADGSMIPFVVRRRADGAIVGSTRYINISRRDRRLEIGWTWYAIAVQGGPVNPDCKFLLLSHAFERLGACRVELRCDARNARSRAAILKLGAVQEGILRRHQLVQGTYLRDTVVYAILDHEWPEVKAELEDRLASFP